jgi:hypothetical protein
MSIRDANRAKKWLSCLKCGRPIYTDRCHRVCPKCHQKNDKEGRIRYLRSSFQSTNGLEQLLDRSLALLDLGGL